jgi:hypothetical protein
VVPHTSSATHSALSFVFFFFFFHFFLLHTSTEKRARLVVFSLSLSLSLSLNQPTNNPAPRRPGEYPVLAVGVQPVLTPFIYLSFQIRRTLFCNIIYPLCLLETPKFLVCVCVCDTQTNAVSGVLLVTLEVAIDLTNEQQRAVEADCAQHDPEKIAHDQHPAKEEGGLQPA